MREMFLMQFLETDERVTAASFILEKILFFDDIEMCIITFIQNNHEKNG
jgi:hypothetical protein